MPPEDFGPEREKGSALAVENRLQSHQAELLVRGDRGADLTMEEENGHC